MKATKRSYLRKLNSLTQLSNAARHWVPDLDTFFVDPAHRLPFDPTVPHAVTLATNEHAADQPLGRATCTCGADTGWLPLWDVELRAHWHRREAEKATSQGSDSRPRFDRTLFAMLARHKSSSQTVRTPPVVPLPILDDQQPILLVYDERDLAIDLAYERNPLPGGTRVRSVSERSMDYWIPRLTPVFAVSDGVIVYARKHLDGHTIIIDHGNDWLSVYHRLEHMFVAPTERTPRCEIKVASGHVLGYLARSGPGGLKPLRFELWKADARQDYQQMDPLRHIRRWRFIDWGSPSAEPQP